MHEKEVTRKKRELVWVTDQREIAWHYFTTWFWLDLFSILPSSFDFYPLIASDSDSGTSRLKVLRVIRIFRLVKLVRLLRASRIITRWQASISVSFATQAIMK